MKEKQEARAENMLQEFLSKVAEIAVAEGVKEGIYEGFRLRFVGDEKELERLQDKIREEGLTFEDLANFKLDYESAALGCAGSYGSQPTNG